MSWKDTQQTRIYKCDNPECACIISYQQKSDDPWKKECPFCQQQTLYLDSCQGDMNLFFDLQRGKTLGSLSEQNIKRAEKDGTLDKKKVPFWRKDKPKIDFNILKNPSKYITTGNT